MTNVNSYEPGTPPVSVMPVQRSGAIAPSHRPNSIASVPPPAMPTHQTLIGRSWFRGQDSTGMFSPDRPATFQLTPPAPSSPSAAKDSSVDASLSWSG